MKWPVLVHGGHPDELISIFSRHSAVGAQVNRNSPWTHWWVELVGERVAAHKFLDAVAAFVAVRLMMAVGDDVAEMLVKVMKLQPKFDPKKIEIVGISLGGQTMGFIAKGIKKRTGTTISRLTGMDPAGPCFRNRGPEGRVDESDADFVDLILTNIDTYGMAAPVGHVNIYVNGGEYQPGVLPFTLCGPFCSHSRAVPIQMISLVFQDLFKAMKCDSVQDARDGKCYDRKPMETITVGPKMDRSARGIYYLATTNMFPYFLGERGLQKEYNYVWNKFTNMNSKDVLQL